MIRDEYVKTTVGRSIFFCSQPWSMEALIVLWPAAAA